MFDQTQIKQLIQAAEQAWYACPHQTCLIWRSCPNEQNIARQTREQNTCNILSFWSNVWCLIECLILPNTIQQHQIRCPNSKMFGYQTRFVQGFYSPRGLPVERIMLRPLHLGGNGMLSPSICQHLCTRFTKRNGEERHLRSYAWVERDAVRGKCFAREPQSQCCTICRMNNCCHGSFTFRHIKVIGYKIPGAHHLERATNPHSCHSVFTDRSVFSLNLPRIQTLQELHWTITSTAFNIFNKHGL